MDLSREYMDSVSARARQSTQEANDLADELFAEVARLIRKDWKPTRTEDSNVIYLWPESLERS